MKRFGMKCYRHVVDPKMLRFKNCKAVLKAIGAPSNIADSLIDLKSNQFLSANDMQKVFPPVIHVCTDSIAFF